MIYGYDFSTEVIEVNYSNGIGYILLHCCESSLGKDCVVFDGFFEHKLNYEMLRVIHNKFVDRKLGKQFGGYICLMYLCGMENTIKNKIGKNLKINNTWELLETWNEGGEEKFNDKVLKGIKTFLKDGTDLGRIKKSYINSGLFCYETTNNIIEISVRVGMNLNRGTWIEITDIKVK